mmetsp:Transcript_36441/g.75843  ORF Transcript_36441/g.75843 Transcript_36441/m.75843 type:complete len:159 (-) Transcript_36441:832-1308(-)
MRSFFLLAVVAPLCHAFAPHPAAGRTTTELQMERRDLLAAGALGLILAAPKVAEAKPASTFFFDEHIETVREEAQLATGGRLDLNSAFVGEYASFPGMYPHAAGKIASNGPYYKVKDIYSIPGLTNHDIEVFKQYDKHFTVNPAGRAFYERINARVST